MEAVGIGRAVPFSERILIDCNDGSCDRLIAEVSKAGTGNTDRKPCIVIVHGLTGCADSSYILRSAWHFLSLGYDVVRLNLRGAGPSRQTCGGFYHAGRAGDIAIALTGLHRHDPAMIRNGCILVGYSLGGSLVLNYLADLKSRETPVTAAATVSTPIDLARTSTIFRQPRNRIYQKWLLQRMKQEVLGGRLTPQEQSAIRKSRNVFEFDDGFVGPHFGFGDASTYYRECSAIRRLQEIDRPVLLVHAMDDPWVPVDPYLTLDWESLPFAKPALVGGGGHVGFHEAGHSVPWHDRYIGSWLESDIALNGE